MTSEMRWCGEQYPDWHADSSGVVYRFGVPVTPYAPNKVHPYYAVWCHGRRVFVHVLVCTAFHGPRPDRMETRHLNDVKTDNRADNLSWGTTAQNQRDAVLNGVHRSWPGEKHGMAKLTTDDVLTIRSLYADGAYSQDKLGRMYGVSQRQISGIVRRTTWRHLPEEATPKVANF